MMLTNSYTYFASVRGNNETNKQINNTYNSQNPHKNKVTWTKKNSNLIYCKSDENSSHSLLTVS